MIVILRKSHHSIESHMYYTICFSFNVNMLKCMSFLCRISTFAEFLVALENVSVNIRHTISVLRDSDLIYSVNSLKKCENNNFEMYNFASACGILKYPFRIRWIFKNKNDINAEMYHSVNDKNSECV